METKRQRQNLMNRRYQLKMAYKKWETKKKKKESELNKLKFETMVEYNNKLANIANRIEEYNFLLAEL